MNEFELAIIGGGLASASAINAYREAGGEGKIALISADSTIPYHRPPLSKRYLRGEAACEDTLVELHSFYFAHGRLVASLERAHDEETEKQLLELVGNRATPCDMLALADESVPLREAFAMSVNAGMAS
jgi:NAD(P)H-nitrite reductase large subunit